MRVRTRARIRRKQVLAAIALAVTLTTAATLATVAQVAFGQVQRITMNSSVWVGPNPVGVGQIGLIQGVVYPFPSYSVNLSFSLTKPDGTVVTIVEASDLLGEAGFDCMCDEVGVWNVKLSFAGDANYDDTGASTTWIVQQAAVPPLAKIETYAYVRAEPSILGLGQAVNITGWLSPPRELIGAVYSNLTFVIVDPNGNAVDRVINSDSAANANFDYVCNQVGSWSVKLSWAGDRLHNSTISNSSTWTVQQTVVPPNPNVPSPAPPTAHIDWIWPNAALVGDTVTFIGSGTDPDGVVVEYRWASNIDGFLSSSSMFSTSSLSIGTHLISFQVQDDSGAWSSEVTQSLTINPASPNPTPGVPVETPLLIVSIIVVGGAALVCTIGYSTGRLFRPSFKKIEKDLQKRRGEEQKEEDEEEKDREENKKKGKPFLKLKIKVPMRLWGSNRSKAEGKITNEGVASAQDILIAVASTPGLVLDKSIERLSELKPLEDRPLVFPFAASNQIKRGNYKLSFEVKSRQTSKLVKDRSLRALKIGLLSDQGGQQYAGPLKNWLKEHFIVWDELTTADNFVKLLEYDLIIVAEESEMPSKWVKNLSNFVDDSQSLLVVDKIKAPNEEMIARTLGYSRMQYEAFKSDEGLFTVSDNQHDITRKFEVGKEIQLQGSCGNACTSNITTGRILVTQVIRRNGEELTMTVPAIVANEFGEGKVVHLNFHAEESMSQLNDILENVFNWLLFKNTFS